MMAAIRGKNTKPEIIVRRFLHRLGFRFRLHRRDLPGRPDIVLPKYRTVVEVRGCFWHRIEGCPFAYMPKSNRVFWEPKLNGNRERDRRNLRELAKWARGRSRCGSVSWVKTGFLNGCRA